MSPPPGSEATRQAPAQYRSQLDILVSLLQVGNAVPDMADPILLGQMVESLQESAAAAPLPGVPDLLRSWKAALQDLGRRGDGLSRDDLTQMSLWFIGLQEHAAGRLGHEGRRMLAQLPEAIDWLPRLSQSFTLVIARRLDAGAVAMAAALPSGIDPDTDHIHAFDVPAFDVPAFDVPAFDMPAFDMPAIEANAFDARAVDTHAAAKTATGHAAVAIDALVSGAAVEDSDTVAFAFGHASEPAATSSGLIHADPAHIEPLHVEPLYSDAFYLAAGADHSVIWIGREELDLTRQAILDQVLPLAQAWSETPDADASAPLVEELLYQCQLIGNVMELIGTSMLGLGMAAVREGIERKDPAVSPETVAMWCNALLAAIEDPSRDAADLLVSVTPDLPGLDERWATALAHEFARVTIGFDPAMIAQRKTVAGFDDIGLAPADDVLPNVLDGMLRELPGNTERLGASIRALADTRSPDPIDEARRVAHTLKGDANTVGFRGLANLTHALEDILVVLAKRPDLLNDDCAELLTSASDCVEEISDHLLGRGPAPDNLLDIYQHVLDTANALADAAAAPAAQAPHARTDDALAPAAETFTAQTSTPADSEIPSTASDTRAPLPAQQEPASPLASTAPSTATLAFAAPSAASEVAPLNPPVAAPATADAGSGIQSLNVASALLDELQRLAGETLVTSRQIDQQIDGLGAIHRDQRQGVRYTQELIVRLDDLVALRGAALQSTAQKAGADIDPLEIDQYNELHVISRQLLEAQADSGEFVRRIDRIMNGLADLRSGQELLNRDLQRTILRTRTVPFGQVSARLQRIVRQTAKQVFKQVELDIVGQDIPVDAELLERIVEPLAHLLRNAIDHGIEAPEGRRAAGKPETGRIVLRVGLQGDAASIELQDDGRGLDMDAIRRRGIEAGLLTVDQDADERTLSRLILLPGFSTRSSASEVSGRGIGMDVVNQRIAALRGTLVLSSEAGRGTRVQMRLPVTQTLANVIVARGQRQVSAVVAASVERVVSFAAGECRYEHGRLTVVLDGDTLPALPIEAFYGDSADVSMWLSGGIGLAVRDPDGKTSVVLVRGIDDVRSVVVKPLATYLPPIPAVRGITQLGDGGLAPVIDLDVLLQSASERRYDTAGLSPTATRVARVVVADDSLSVRRALEQLMQDAGFEVATARDGFEALAEIQARPTDALLVDLEMPRMNGLEVTRNLRNHAETRDLPVVMITSRASDKYLAMAEQAGVTRMLGKPFSEDTLVALVRGLIAEREAAASAAGADSHTAFEPLSDTTTG